MLEQSFWHKRFSVGLPMNITVGEFRRFVNRFCDYIDNIYLSPPMGDRFHGREQIAEQFKDRETVCRFWQLAEIIKEYNLSLEIVFNTHKLIPGDMEKCRKMFDDYHIEVNKVAVLDCIDWYYDSAKQCFPEADIVQSVNNMKDSPEGFRHYKNKYEEIVLGRHLIRSTEAARIIKEDVKAKCILLLNNGCSFICGGCQEKNYCKKVYDKAREHYSAEYLYALQSIMPYELHEGYFSLDYYDYFKLSTRNGDADFLNKSMDSYINNNAEEYIAWDSKNYFLWGRLAWHIPHYDSFSFDRIKEYKKQICGLINDSESVND